MAALLRPPRLAPCQGGPLSPPWHSYPLVGWLADRSLDGVLFALAALCAAFAFATRLGARQVPDGPGSQEPA